MSLDDDRRKVREAQARYAATHWGDLGDGQTIEGRAADPRDELTILGRLVEVTYVTTKRGDPKNCHYWHDFNFRKPPILAFNPEGLLVIVGGAYRVTSRGIVG